MWKHITIRPCFQGFETAACIAKQKLLNWHYHLLNLKLSMMINEMLYSFLSVDMTFAASTDDHLQVSAIIIFKHSGQ